MIFAKFLSFLVFCLAWNLLCVKGQGKDIAAYLTVQLTYNYSPSLPSNISTSRLDEFISSPLSINLMLNKNRLTDYGSKQIDQNISAIFAIDYKLLRGPVRSFSIELFKDKAVYSVISKYKTFNITRQYDLFPVTVNDFKRKISINMLMSTKLLCVNSYKSKLPYFLGPACEIRCDPAKYTCESDGIKRVCHFEEYKNPPDCSQIDYCSYKPCKVGSYCLNWQGTFSCICDSNNQSCYKSQKQCQTNRLVCPEDQGCRLLPWKKEESCACLVGSPTCDPLDLPMKDACVEAAGRIITSTLEDRKLNLPQYNPYILAIDSPHLMDEAHNLLCSNGQGTCVSSRTSKDRDWHCKCKPGFQGDRCEMSTNTSNSIIILCGLLVIFVLVETALIIFLLLPGRIRGGINSLIREDQDDEM